MNKRKPYHSINFVIAHDGFTLYDLVSYNLKVIKYFEFICVFFICGVLSSSYCWFCSIMMLMAKVGMTEAMTI